MKSKVYFKFYIHIYLRIYCFIKWQNNLTFIHRFHFDNLYLIWYSQNVKNTVRLIYYVRLNIIIRRAILIIIIIETISLIIFIILKYRYKNIIWKFILLFFFIRVSPTVTSRQRRVRCGVFLIRSWIRRGVESEAPTAAHSLPHTIPALLSAASDRVATASRSSQATR